MGEARYLPLPEISPYIDTSRFGQPKETFKHTARRLRELAGGETRHRHADVACANGEFLHYLHGLFPDWELAGFDYEPAFLDVARKAVPDVRFEERDLFTLDRLGERFDTVTMLGSFPIFRDPWPPLEQLLSIVEPGGWLLVDGYFNPYDVDVRVEFRDDSVEESRGIWRADFHQHSRRTIGQLLEGRCAEFWFEEIEMGVELPRREDAPHIHAWTFRDAEGRNRLTNGAQLLLDDTLMVVRK